MDAETSYTSHITYLYFFLFMFNVQVKSKDFEVKTKTNALIKCLHCVQKGPNFMCICVPNNLFKCKLNTLEYHK
jgi:hypothetical protein